MVSLFLLQTLLTLQMPQNLKLEIMQDIATICDSYPYQIKQHISQKQMNSILRQAIFKDGDLITSSALNSFCEEKGYHA